MSLTLAALTAGLPGIDLVGDDRFEVSSITADSRRADEGSLFVAVKGTAGDGHDYLDEVRRRGCRALAIERQALPADTTPQPGPDGPAVVIIAEQTRNLPARLARRLQDVPDASLTTAAVTGTNGKTTVAFLLRELLARLQGPCGLLGTISYDDGRRRLPASLTTPGGPELYAWLGAMRDNGCRSVALELSSHALDQERAADLQLDVAVMTNIGRDHLDYHGDTEAYVAAKALIRELLRPADGQRAGTLIVNARDPWLAPLADNDDAAIRFSTDAKEAPADLAVRQARLTAAGTDLDLDWRGRQVSLSSPLVGRFNVENLTAAMAAGLALGFEPEACAEALGRTPQVPGRLERISLPSGGLAVVDYAHTPDALAAVLATCRELTDRRVLTVFGCGGDRDRGKRPLMGEVAARDSDLVWITSDNPRSEDPATICADVAAGFDAVAVPRAGSRQVVADRTNAIREALADVGDGDILVVAGKGHEDYQLVGDQRLDLDDRRIIRDWVNGVTG